MKWLKETGFPFDMILDSERKIYHTFGLYRSVSKVWSIGCMLYYTEQLLNGRQLPRPLENVHDDPQQMGGDFILDSTGRVVFSYCSQVSSDRPTIDHILAAIVRHTSQGKVSQENSDAFLNILDGTHICVCQYNQKLAQVLENSKNAVRIFISIYCYFTTEAYIFI
ncbi:hypothetical protein Btru_055421 [Bulinus truncatus]|nr:hypothetical protein Btru_055421 [Bulinus truncatus]